MTILEITIFSINEHLVAEILNVSEALRHMFAFQYHDHTPVILNPLSCHRLTTLVPP